MINLCLPSILYFITYIILAIIGYIYFKKYNLIDFIGDFIMLFFFTWLLNYLCNKDYKSVSWILFVIFIIISIITMYIIKKLNLSYDDIYSDPAQYTNPNLLFKK
jgi:ABC-type multidrug transport system fused ATPase/permease subunit